MFALSLRSAFDINLAAGQSRSLLTAWLVFHVVGGQVLLPILFATFLFTRAVRHPVMVNMVATWIVASTIACLVFYGGEYYYDDPEQAAKAPLCKAQAAMMQHAVPPMLATSSFALIYHVRSTVRTTIVKDLPKAFQWLHTLRTAILVTLPYVTFAVFSLAGGISVMSRPNEVSLVRRELYCALEHSSMSIVSALFSALVLLATAYFEISIVLTLRRNSTGQREAGVEDSFQRALLIRVVIFGVYCIVGFVLSVVTVFVSTPAPDLFIATVPVVVFIVFGCQGDVLTVWSFWRKFKTPSRPSIKGPRMKIEDDAA
ncbi:hypothetical protein BKA62DRAFT_758507 [Auriculariales sp. MPI-PUGE-AT-0066]|nr:hypothetical protein BKA62DRAFT_758507 [Auriculariales sp. MPI-PUGE-AT-0066]